MKEGGFLLHKPSGDLIFTQEEWADLCRKITVWLWNGNIYCTCKEMKQKLLDNGFVSYSA